MNRRTILILTVSLFGLLAFEGASAAIPVGALTHDGPGTPEQLALFLPVTGSLPFTATASVRYKPTISSTWEIGHPLHRIRTDFYGGGSIVPVEEGFAWPIIDLIPNTSYDVEVTVENAGESEVRTATFTTRALPPAAGANKIVIPIGSTSGQIETLIEGASPGDVVEFSNGAYALDSTLLLAVSGTPAAPVYIRGQSRAGVVLSRASGGTAIHFVGNSSNLIFEDMTLQGTGVDSGIGPTPAIQFHTDAANSSGVTFRRLTVNGFDQAIVSTSRVNGIMVYDSIFNGNNQWNQDLYAYGGSGAPGTGDGTPDLNQNIFWNDDGIRLPGLGNVIFNNTFRGFGDTLSYCSHSGGSTLAECRGIHFYRNDVYDSGDDGAEIDHAFRNVSLYDNRFTNAGAFISLDPLHGGPFLGARNIGINISRTPLKQNATITGQFFYNNTQILTNHRHPSGWHQFNDGALRSWGYRNNIFIYHGSADTMAILSSGNDPIDFTHNSFYPDRGFAWSSSGGSGSTLAQVQANISATTPIFSGASKRHQDDNITESQPFVDNVAIGSNYLNRVTQASTPILRSGTAPRGTGVAIANITDGFSGAAPDRGAIISGRGVPIYGDRSAITSPNPPTDLTAAD